MDSPTQVGRADLISQMMTNDAFVAEHMPFLYDNGELVLGSYAEAVYALRSQIDVEELIDTAVRGISKRVRDFSIRSGTAFTCAVASAIPFPPGYTASRLVADRSEIHFAVVGSLSAAVSVGASDTRAGAAILVFGVLTDEQSVDARLAFDSGLAYLNDVLTSYRLVRHDHGIMAVSPRQLQGTLDCYSIVEGDPPTVSKTKPVVLHQNDQMDVWAKRSLLPEEYARFLARCEGLSYSPEIRYLLNLGVDSVDDLCLGRFESAVLNSDRFMELSLRLCYLRHPLLPDDKLPRLTSVYSRNPRASTVLSSLMPALGIHAEAFLNSWVEHSRSLRNKVAHRLDFNAVTPSGAHLAVEYNLALIQMIACSFSEEEWDVRLLGEVSSTYENLFGRHR